MGKVVKPILITAIFVICIVLIIIGQKNIGLQGLAAMLVGLAGLLGLLFQYNKKYTK